MELMKKHSVSCTHRYSYLSRVRHALCFFVLLDDERRPYANRMERKALLTIGVCTKNRTNGHAIARNCITLYEKSYKVMQR